jgi:hypothetical protein
VFPKARMPQETGLRPSSNGLDHLGGIVGRATSLAEAVQMLPETWPSGEASEASARSLLAGADGPWVDRCWLDALSCQPPVHRMSERSHGLAFLRWLLHRVLPYECFLWSDARLALRLGVSVSDLDEALRADESLFQQAHYRGVLHDFMGRRWWRSAIESELWEKTDGKSDGSEVAALLEPSLGRMPTLLDGRPVICIGEDLSFLPEPEPSSGCVRLEPDDWPTFADQAWTTRTLAESHAELRSLVVPRDRWWE